MTQTNFEVDAVAVEPVGGRLVSVEEASEMIQSGHCLSIAAHEDVLTQLPKGVWVGGTIPYFMGQEGGICDQQRVFVSELQGFTGIPSVRFYSKEQLNQVALDAPEHGFSVIVMPAGSSVHEEYARNAPSYEDMYMKPIVGWVSGIHLDDMGEKTAAVFNGTSGEFSRSDCVVMHLELPLDQAAEIHTVNLFSQGEGAAITFPQSGFTAGHCNIDGEVVNLAEYVESQGLDIRLPLVADYCGMLVNVSMKSIANGLVEFYAPVFEGVRYRFAEPVDNYVEEFQRGIPELSGSVQFSCNCILNYLYSELEGKQVAVNGPMTFGEIAYQLLNQTLVYLTVERIDEC